MNFKSLFSSAKKNGTVQWEKMNKETLKNIVGGIESTTISETADGDLINDPVSTDVTPVKSKSNIRHN